MSRKMKRFLYICAPYLKYLALALYLSIAAILWFRRDSLPAPALLGSFTRNTIVFAVLYTGLVCLYSALRCPFGIAKRAKETFAGTGLCNAKGEVPTLLSVMADRDKPHGKILKVRNKGISINDFDQKISRLEAGLGGVIYHMEYGRGAKTTRLFLLPMRYVRPTIITPKDEALGPIHIRQLINLLVVGATGTGKTVAIKTILGKIINFSQKSPEFSGVGLWILDFKMLDFKAYTDLPHYYGYTGCMQGLEDYYAAFKAQQTIGVAGEPQYLIVDEWGSFIMSLPKKEAECYKAILAELLMLGRGYGFYIICGVQRPDASYFNSARDNFRACLALGNLSPEGQRMVFPDSAIRQITECRQREGHLYIDGRGLEKVRMADISNLDTLDAIICSALNH